jgi:P-type conjugative transfer protein TrbJ
MLRKFSLARPLTEYLGGSLFGFAATGSLAMVLTMQPAAAQITVFDPTNYSQTTLTAARTLQQINNQIQSLQNEAAMILNQAKNLTRIDFPELQQLTQTMQQIDRLMGQARGITFQVSQVDSQLAQLFPRSLNEALTSNARVVDARSRLDTAMDAHRQTMTVQAQIVDSIRSDSGALAAIVAKSQGAEGALQASQAMNQLLALLAKQQMQLQQLMVAQFRAQALEQARQAQAEAEARAATVKFLGSGTAYTPR